jgi:hypothetical protein
VRAANLAKMALKLSEESGIPLCEAIEKVDADGAARKEIMDWCEDIVCASMVKVTFH